MAAGNPLGTRYVERFLRGLFNPQGPIDYAQRLGGEVSPSIECRPVYPWDFRDFGILPWAGRYTIGALAAQYSYVECAAAAPGGYDLVIKEARANTIALFLLTATAANTGVHTNQGVSVLDSGIGTFGAYDVNLANISTGQTTGGAVAGFTVQGLPLNVTVAVDVVLRAGIAGAFATFFAGALNTAVTVDLKGYLIPSSVANL